MVFYLGTHRPHWLRMIDIPMFISHHQLKNRKRLPEALGPWALDSGGFTEIDRHGQWVTTEDQYVAAVSRYSEEIGNLAWAAPMDWMCEPWMLEKTGLSVREHQQRTVENYVAIRDRGPFIPVLQGWTLADYHACVEMYDDAGVDLAALPLVGLGSVCRRQSGKEIGWIVRSLSDLGLRLHGFGVKTQGLERYGRLLASADSMAWSMGGRYSRLPGCSHKMCANCMRYALRWRDQVISFEDQLTLEAA